MKKLVLENCRISRGELAEMSICPIPFDPQSPGPEHRQDEEAGA